jgi:hypothetical protein
MPDYKVIGFLHADCYFEAREVDEIDRDTLWAFAEGFGFAVDRALLIERLNRQRHEVGRLVQATSAVLNDLTDAELRMTRDTSESTVKSHVKNVMRKLRSSNRSQAVATYRRIVAADRDAG